MHNSADNLRIERATLYEQIWTIPTAKLAKQYGISDVALAKICRRLDVPKPGRGYWARPGVDTSPKRPALPAVRRGAPTHVFVRPRRADRRPVLSRRVGPAITVATRLDRPHRFVATTARAPRGAKPTYEGLIVSRGSDVLAIRVSPQLLSRALRLMDALLKALEANGHSIRIGADKRSETIVIVAGEQLSIRLTERLLRSEHVLTPEAEADRARYNHTWARRSDFRPSGCLRVQLYRPGFSWTEKRWDEGKPRLLEKRLGTVVAGLEAYADTFREERTRRAEEERRRQEEWLRRDRERQAREEQARRFERVRHAATRWREAELVREFLRAVEAAHPELREVDAFRAWVSWAERSIDLIDPLPNVEALDLFTSPAST